MIFIQKTIKLCVFIDENRLILELRIKIPIQYIYNIA